MGAQAVRLSNVDIDNALKNKDFEVLFQPIFDLGNGAVARMESFVRWRHPQLGMLPPGAFISFFESQGRMGELTRFILDEALAAYVAWRGINAPGLSINLALADLTDEALPSHFQKLLRDKNFPADLITLECPMPSVESEMEVARGHFAKLAETGARMAIEVRGRANDMLRDFDPFPFHEIKTGGSSILRFARTVRGPGLSAISDLLELANRVNAAITAVGVEDQASLTALKNLGFTAAQGNHLAHVGELQKFRPAKVNEVRHMLGLEQLTADDLAALFRTGIPQPAAPNAPLNDLAEDAKRPAENQIVQDSTAPTANSTHEEARKLRARKKARALAEAKKASTVAARKAAAIARAKARAAEESDAPTPESAQENAPERAQKAPVEAPMQSKSAEQPRAMQERLNKLFAKPALPATRGKTEFHDTAARAEERAPSPAAPVSAETGSAVCIKLAHAPAYFDAVQYASITPAPPSPPAAAATRPAPPISPQEMLERIAKQKSPSTEASSAPKTTPERIAELARENFSDDDFGSLLEEENAPQTESEIIAAAPASSQRRSRKPFLQRTVIPYPTHFWPRSWRRTFRRLRQSLAARRNAQDN